MARPKKDNKDNITDFGMVNLSVELIIIPEEVRRLTIAPAINLVRWHVRTATKNVQIASESFDTPHKARQYYAACQDAFVR